MNIWRKFESEQAFASWHEQSKQLLNMPIVGVRASDGVPQPDKQQTTDYTALTYQNLELDSDGEPIIPAEPPLDAVVADDSIIPLVSVLVRADMMLPEELAALANAYPAWQAGEAVAVDDLRSYGDMLWKATQAHTTQADWQPDVAVSLWVRTAPPDVIPEWRQPLGGHDAYPVGYQVTLAGDLYVNERPANVSQPGTFDSGWKLIVEEPPPSEAIEWAPGQTVVAGDERSWLEIVYVCIQGHTTQAGWEPPNVPALWGVKP